MGKIDSTQVNQFNCQSNQSRRMRNKKKFPNLKNILPLLEEKMKENE